MIQIGGNVLSGIPLTCAVSRIAGVSEELMAKPIIFRMFKVVSVLNCPTFVDSLSLVDL
jgi:hypothetical protein